MAYGKGEHCSPLPVIMDFRKGEHCSPFFVVVGVEARPLHSKYIGNMQ